jgi:hypothetical protein
MKQELQQKPLTYLGTGDMQVQNSNMIFHCLCKSISKEVLAVVFTKPECYTLTVPNNKSMVHPFPKNIRLANKYEL